LDGYDTDGDKMDQTKPGISDPRPGSYASNDDQGQTANNESHEQSMQQQDEIGGY
jgi:hypothetical protein